MCVLNISLQRVVVAIDSGIFRPHPPTDCLQSRGRRRSFFLVTAQNQLGMVLIRVAVVLDGQRRLLSQHAFQRVDRGGIQVARTIVEATTGFVVKVVLVDFANLGKQDATANHVHGQLGLQKDHRRGAQLLVDLVGTKNGDFLGTGHVASVLKERTR